MHAWLSAMQNATAALLTAQQLRRSAGGTASLFGGGGGGGDGPLQVCAARGVATVDEPWSAPPLLPYSRARRPLSISPSAQTLCAIPGNEECAECGEPRPDWCSLNLGVPAALNVPPHPVRRRRPSCPLRAFYRPGRSCKPQSAARAAWEPAVASVARRRLLLR